MVTTKLGSIYRMLTGEDFKILSFLVKRLPKEEYVPLEAIVRRFGRALGEKEVAARVKKLQGLKLVERHPTMEAYRLKFLGLDCYALYLLVNKNVIRALGSKVGMGKESEVYQGLSDSGSPVAVKFYRIGRISFKHFVRARAYGAASAELGWMLRSIRSGLREAKALGLLNEHGVTGVPRLHGAALHAVVTDFIEGVELYRVRELEDPEGALYGILDVLKEAYRKAGLVHGDLSEYNVMVTRGGEVYIIDWPQWALATEPQAPDLLRKDVENLVKFFRRRFRVGAGVDETLKYILS